MLKESFKASCNNDYPDKFYSILQSALNVTPIFRISIKPLALGLEKWQIEKQLLEGGGTTGGTKSEIHSLNYKPCAHSVVRLLFPGPRQ